MVNPRAVTSFHELQGDTQVAQNVRSDPAIGVTADTFDVHFVLLEVYRAPVHLRRGAYNEFMCTSIVGDQLCFAGTSEVFEPGIGDFDCGM